MAAPAVAPSALPPSRRHSAPSRRRRAAPPHRRPSLRLVRGTAHAVTHLPESSAVIGISRSRRWIAVVGILLIGIVAINVLTVSYGSMASNVETDIQKLENRNAILESSKITALSMPRVRSAAVASGMAVPDPTDIRYLNFSDGDIAAAAERLAADGG